MFLVATLMLLLNLSHLEIPSLSLSCFIVMDIFRFLQFAWQFSNGCWASRVACVERVKDWVLYGTRPFFGLPVKLFRLSWILLYSAFDLALAQVQRSRVACGSGLISVSKDSVQCHCITWSFTLARWEHELSLALSAPEIVWPYKSTSTWSSAFYDVFGNLPPLCSLFCSRVLKFLLTFLNIVFFTFLSFDICAVIWNISTLKSKKQ